MEFKCGNVVPIYKKGDASLVENYRPVTILPTAEKIMERCIHNIIFNITKMDIKPNQHGFMEKRSTTTQLLEFYNKVHKNLETNKQYDVAFLDLSKAFDRVPHRLLLHKLKTFGYCGSLLKWFENYLSYRRQCVVMGGHKSKLSIVTSGVPQGSILGPLLFLYYINDMFDCIDGSLDLYLYADDAKIGHTINNLNDGIKLQTGLNNLVKWCSTWGMLFNCTKCVFMSFSKSKNCINCSYNLNGVCLEKVKTFTDLGVIINDKLTCDDHVNQCIKNANRRLGLIKRTTGYSCNTGVKLLCYTSLVRPLLEFSSQVWNCNNKKSLMSRVESVQRRASKYILCDFDSDYLSRLTKLNLLPLSLRRDFLDIIFLFNCQNDLIDINQEHIPTFVINNNPRTRQDHDDLLLEPKATRYNLYACFYQNRVVNIWNCIPYDIRNIELTARGYNTYFKKEFKTWIYNFFLRNFDQNNTCTWSISCLCTKCKP
jgi:hypothetical protein